MFVKWRMTAQPYTIGPDATVPEAVELMRTKQVRKLPVIHEGRLIGVISQSDIDRASPSVATSFSAGEVAYLIGRLKVARVMSRNPVTIDSEALLEQAAILMRAHKVEMLPVMTGNRLVGVITESDLLEAFIDLNGARDHGSRLVIDAEDSPGVLAKLTSITAEAATNITHVAVYRGQHDRSIVVLGINNFNTERLEEQLTAAGFTIKRRLLND